MWYKMGFSNSVWYLMTWLLLLWISDSYCYQRNQEGQQFSYASYYGSNMVLQKAPQQAKIWGYASADDVGKLVYLNLSNAFQFLTFKAVVQPDLNGERAVWEMLLSPISDTHPFSLISKLDNYLPITLDNVLFGDIWVCSGQSNMKFTISEIFNASEEAAIASQFDKIRFFSVGQVTSSRPEQDLTSIEIHWSMPNKKTVMPFSAVCWLYAKNIFMKRGVPMGLIESSWGGTDIESWSSPDSLHACHLPSVRPRYEVIDWQEDNFNYYNLQLAYSSLWNAMIYPLLKLTIYGVIWYQGEANAGFNRDLYNCTFPAMIADWRQKWLVETQGQTDLYFPFGFVQLGPTDGKPVIAGYADIRWHQTADIGFTPNDILRNVFMAVAFDLTDKTVHYRDKITVSRRLALSGLAIAYGQTGFRYQGPWITNITGNSQLQTVMLMYDDGKDQLVVRNTEGFEICCKASCQKDGDDWLKAPVESDVGIQSTGVITLDVSACPSISDINGLRYGWRETPFPYFHASVYSLESDLPAPPLILMSHGHSEISVQSVADG